MTTEEIFAEISAHQIKGVMLHAQMSECFDFLNLCGWKKLHKHRMCEELKDYCRIRAFYICEYGVLLQDKKTEDPAVIPTSWHGKARSDVDASTKRRAVREKIRHGVDREKETKKLYESYYTQLGYLSDATAMQMLCDMICETSEEVKMAEKMLLELEDVDYDMCTIYQMQNAAIEK